MLLKWPKQASRSSRTPNKIASKSGLKNSNIESKLLVQRMMLTLDLQIAKCIPFGKSSSSVKAK